MESRIEAHGNCLPQWAAALVILFVLTSAGRAEDYVEHFNGPNPSWKVLNTDKSIRTVTHRRSAEHGKDRGGEQVVVETARDDQTLRLEHLLPKVRVLNELEVGLWVNCPQPGLQVNLRVVLPEYDDPETGRHLQMLIPGEVLEEVDTWQRIACRTDDKLVQERLRLLRATHKRSLSPKLLSVDRVILTWPLTAGVNELSLDELTLEPVVRLEETPDKPAEPDAESTDDPPVQFRLDRLEIEGKPFFPRITTYHGQPMKDLAEQGFNVVWVPDYTDDLLLKAVRREKMWAAAMPPVVRGSQVDAAEPGDAGLIPFASQTRPIAFWMLGTRMTPQTQTQLVIWVDQIQAADRKYRRPLAADVSGEESVFSRELDLLGISRHTIATTLHPQDYRDWLIARRDWARPGSLCWTWIQVTPVPHLADLWEHHQIPQQIEPEQIRLQAYAALAAGMRGIGFWTPRPLNENDPADRETILALRQINWELWLMEPWLATANSVTRIPITIDAAVKKSVTSAPPRFQYRKPKNSQNPYDPEGNFATHEPETVIESKSLPEMSAALLRTDFGTMLLPMWLDQNAQFVPGPMAFEKVKLVVPGMPETASVWEISTTGVHNLDRDRRRVSGGIEVTLRNFDQTACLLITPDRQLIEQARQRVASIEERSARTSLALAELKLERVRAVDQQLGEFGLKQPDGPQLLGRARTLYLDARESVSQQNWPRVKLRSQQALQMTRVLQRAHWEDAVRDLPSPVASPFTVSFQSLPLQARFASAVLPHQRNLEVANLLPTGSFEDVQALTAVGWEHEQDVPDKIRADAELNPDAKQGRYSLRLTASALHTPGATTAPLGREFVSVTTPPMTVHADQVVRVSGWIKLPQAPAETQDGVLVFDSIGGRGLALRFREACDWTRFEFVREILKSQEMSVTFTLTGLGEVSLDELSVSVHPLTEITQTSGTGSRSRPAPSQTRWPDLRRQPARPKR